MKRLSMVAVVIALVAFSAGQVLAWQCPVQWKKAEEAIAKAESGSVPADAKTMLADAKRLVAESKKHHEGNTKVEHAHSMWKAKAALAIAESVITISQP